MHKRRGENRFRSEKKNWCVVATDYHRRTLLLTAWASTVARNFGTTAMKTAAAAAAAAAVAAAAAAAASQDHGTTDDDGETRTGRTSPSWAMGSETAAPATTVISEASGHNHRRSLLHKSDAFLSRVDGSRPEGKSCRRSLRHSTDVVYLFIPRGSFHVVPLMTVRAASGSTRSTRSRGIKRATNNSTGRRVFSWAIRCRAFHWRDFVIWGQRKVRPGLPLFRHQRRPARTQNQQTASAPRRNVESGSRRVAALVIVLCVHVCALFLFVCAVSIRSSFGVLRVSFFVHRNQSKERVGIEENGLGLWPDRVAGTAEAAMATIATVGAGQEFQMRIRDTKRWTKQVRSMDMSLAHRQTDDNGNQKLTRLLVRNKWTGISSVFFLVVPLSLSFFLLLSCDTSLSLNGVTASQLHS